MKTSTTRKLRLGPVAVLAATAALCPAAAAGILRERLQMAGSLDDGSDSTAAARAPEGTRVVRDIPYGPDKAQRFDVYVSTKARDSVAAAPVILFVHGGAWAYGDKANRQVVEPKVAHWIDQGWVVISVDYRMLPTPVATQAEDVAAALAFAQAQAGLWGADPKRFVLMGHSAGAHLVALVGAGLRTSAKPLPWRGTVMLDSAALDVPVVMNARHFGLYDRAFGKDPRQWTAVSPIAQLARGTAPFLAVCSSRRKESCAQAERFAARANSMGGKARVLRADLSHMEINATLGAGSDYTSQVDAFLNSLR